MKSDHGVTLAELLIVVAILAILAGLIYPTYQSYIIKVRRGDAQTELLKAQLKQTNFHILNAYSSSAESVGLPISDDYYNFSVVSAGRTTYQMKAVAKEGTTQAKDDLACQVLVIDQNSKHTRDGSIENDQCW